MNFAKPRNHVQQRFRNNPRKRSGEPFYRQAAKSAKDLQKNKIHLFGVASHHTNLIQALVFLSVFAT